MKFMLSFNYLDTEDKTVRGYDYHPLYTEIRHCFTSFLGSPIDEEKYIERHINYDGKEIKFDMERYTLTYSVAWNELAHLTCLVELLENLELGCDFEMCCDWERED